MNKILIVIFLSIILILSEYAIYGENENVNWHVQADFLSSNYPDCTYNDKALMLADDMKKANESFQIIRRYYKNEIIYIFSNGIRIWPPYRNKSIIEKYEKLEIIDEKMEVYPKK